MWVSHLLPLGIHATVDRDLLEIGVIRTNNKTGLNRKRLLMPLSIAALTSGMMTLIASPPNMIIDNTLRARGLAPFGFFSWTPFGLAVLATGILFVLAVRRHLSQQLAGEDAATPGEKRRGDRTKAESEPPRDRLACHYSATSLRARRFLWPRRSLASVARACRFTWRSSGPLG